MLIQVDCFRAFKRDVSSLSLPERFTFPFYYDPHPLCLVAAAEVQSQLMEQLNEEAKKLWEEAGKMFGVLVVKDQSGRLGYLAAFSGKLANSNHYEGFVPPVFDMLSDGSFFMEGMKELNAINKKIERLEASEELKEATLLLEKQKKLAAGFIERRKAENKAAKKARKLQRQQAVEALDERQFTQLDEQLQAVSKRQRRALKELIAYWDNKLEAAQTNLDQLKIEINALKEERKNKSAALQERLFENYSFLNINGEAQNLMDIFHPFQPPAGAGECAAPKLLQYSFQYDLTPIAMAEFWWGASPKSEVRRHKRFYPACRGKCEPILGHMLKGISTDPNPMLKNTAINKEIEILFEDDQIILVNKPAEFLSVPGKNVRDSVQARLQMKYPDLEGPLMVHRLDMSTSGLMVVAKHKEAHRRLQYQFIKRKIKKRYVAVLDGTIEKDSGTIDLPLRVDLADRPRQIVCFEHGKSARTHWEVVSRNKDSTRVYFYPVTGRTHQLRVHAAHQSGLDCAIKGDDIYGIKGERLLLHAEWIQFLHPANKELFSFELKADF